MRSGSIMLFSRLSRGNQFSFFAFIFFYREGGSSVVFRKSRREKLPAHSNTKRKAAWLSCSFIFSPCCSEGHTSITFSFFFRICTPSFSFSLLPCTSRCASSLYKNYLCVFFYPFSSSFCSIHLALPVQWFPNWNTKKKNGNKMRWGAPRHQDACCLPLRSSHAPPVLLPKSEQAGNVHVPETPTCAFCCCRWSFLKKVPDFVVNPR